ncbi:MAG: hypothetical protein IPM27_02760 [Nitrosomonadales bacterium]|nr:hypothetical protein [Nitrosomonadales bacterium]
MEEFQLTTKHPIPTGEIVTIAIDEDNMSLIAFTADGKKIGNIDLEERGDCYYIKWMCLDQLDPKYTHKGIGRAALSFFKEVYMCSITAAEYDGARRDDGSHLTGNAPGFIAKMRDEGIVSYNYEPEI